MGQKGFQLADGQGMDEALAELAQQNEVDITAGCLFVALGGFGDIGESGGVGGRQAVFLTEADDPLGGARFRDLDSFLGF